MTRDELVDLRNRVIMGSPPYEREPVMNQMVRKSGTPGLDELRKTGDFGPHASSIVLALEVGLALIERALETEEQ